MENTVDWVRRILQETSVTQIELAHAIGVDPTIMSKMVNGKRKITADERARMASHFDSVRRAGFAEEQAAFERAAHGTAPIYRARPAAQGEWIIDKGAGAIRLERPPDRAGHFLDVFGFHAPDDAAWPRYKVKEIVWVCPNETAAPGDDILLFTKSRNRSAIRGIAGELISQSAASIVYREFATREARQVNAASVAVHCLASRER
jgi:transcriptional regulator with XRE-family HTH domain